MIQLRRRGVTLEHELLEFIAKGLGIFTSQLPLGRIEQLPCCTPVVMLRPCRQPPADTLSVLVAVPALIDFHAAAATMTNEESMLAHRLSTEWLFRQCDAVTRRTGYLTKTIRCTQTAFRPARPAIRPCLAFHPRSPMRCT